MNRLLATLLAGSLAVNLWLGWKWAATPTEKEPPSPGPAAFAPPAASGIPAHTSAWRSLTDTPPAELLPKLAAEGMSPEMIRAILRVRLREKYRAEWEASTVVNRDRADWWRINVYTPAMQDRYMARRQLNARIDAELDELLGEKQTARSDDSRYWFLSAERAEAVRQIVADYQPLRAAYAADVSKLGVLEAERRRDLAGILSAEELAEYELRFAPEAEQLRHRTSHAAVSEAEFRQLVGLQMEFEPRMRTAKSFAERLALDDAYEAAIFRTLGSERAPDFLWSSDTGYRSAKLALSAQQLPAQPAVDLRQLQGDITGRAFAIASNSSATPDAKRAALRVLATEARTKLAGLTPPGFLFPSNSIVWIEELDRGGVMRNFAVNNSAMGTRVGP